jgi:hypothetical protein
MAQAPWQLTRQGPLQITFDEDHPCYKNYTTKKRRDSGWGGATPFF